MRSVEFVPCLPCGKGHYLAINEQRRDTISEVIFDPAYLACACRGELANCVQSAKAIKSLGQVSRKLKTLAVETAAA